MISLIRKAGEKGRLNVALKTLRKWPKKSDPIKDRCD